MKLPKVLNKILRSSLFSTFLLFVPILAQAESIELFESRIEISDDGSFNVYEQITYDFGTADRHGIFRYIPHRHPQTATAWYKKRQIEVEVQSVTRDGEVERYVVSESNGQTDIKIGKAEEFITGKHVYQIQYKVTSGLSYLDAIGVTEVYWNITGNGWQVPIKRAVGLISPASSLGSANYCYRGSVNSITPCDEKDTYADGVAFIANDLKPYEGLTIASELKDGLPVVVHEEIIKFFVIMPIIFALIASLVYRIYRYKTYFKPNNLTVVPQYEPYRDVLPMFSGVLIDGRLDGRDVTAGILYLAENGFIKIKKTDRKALFFINIDDYEVKLLKPISDASTHFHRKLLYLIFSELGVGEVVSLGDLKKNQSTQRKNYKKLQELKKSVEKDLVERGFYEKKFGFRRKTQKGYEAVWHLKGFKDFLKVTDEERFKFHNAPKKSPEQFLQYLPFAVAFGVEKEWAEVFKDITIDQPDWYEGPVGSFSAVNLGTELSTISTAVNAASGSGYSSSSSAGGGGGFSGGGGGGGGGGSW